jgi:hypothetical protein
LVRSVGKIDRTFFWLVGWVALVRRTKVTLLATSLNNNYLGRNIFTLFWLFLGILVIFVYFKLKCLQLYVCHKIDKSLALTEFC